MNDSEAFRLGRPLAAGYTDGIFEEPGSEPLMTLVSRTDRPDPADAMLRALQQICRGHVLVQVGDWDVRMLFTGTSAVFCLAPPAEASVCA